MKKNLKRFFIVILPGITVISLAGCSGSSSSTGQSEDVLVRQLSELEGVTNVSKVEISEENKESTNFESTYVVKFSQPIDWEDPSKGTFEQRVLFGYKGTDNKTNYNADGYMLNDKDDEDYFQHAKGLDEIQGYYDCNYIDIEYRFFGDSVPEGLSVDSSEYWEYLTSENASKDFHHIITEMSKILPGDTFFTGCSKGGYTTENMAYYYPDDIDCYISMCAPLCDGISDPRLVDGIYTSIGDNDPLYGEEKAGYYRNVMLEVQKLFLDEKYRSIIQPKLFEKMNEGGYELSPLVTKDEAYEASVADIAVAQWMYGTDFSLCESIAGMTDDTEEEFDKRREALEELYWEYKPEDNVSYTTTIAPYPFQAYTEMGNYGMDFSYLREAGANVKTPEDNEDDLFERLYCPYLAGGDYYSEDHRNELIEFMDTTDKDIIKIYGLSDPWYYVKAPETNNSHIHIFEVSGGHRAARPSSMSDEQKKVFYTLVDRILSDS